MTNMRRNPWITLAGIALAWSSTASLAAPVTYYGSQGPKTNLLSATPPDLSTSVASARNGFNNSITRLGSNEFEASTTPATFAYTGGTASVSSGAPTVINGDTRTAAQLGQGRYNMTAGTVNPNTGLPGFGHWLEATTDFTYVFSTAVSAFGFYGTDFGDFAGSFSIDFLNGSNLVYSTPVANAGSNGNLLFFGLVSTDSFNTVVFHINQAAGGSTVDVLGFDSFIVGRANAAGPGQVPEPGSLALVGLALAGLVFVNAGRSRRTAPR